MVKLALKVFFLKFVIQFYPSKGKLNPMKKFTISFLANKFISLYEDLKPVKNKKVCQKRKHKLSTIFKISYLGFWSLVDIYLIQN